MAINDKRGLRLEVAFVSVHFGHPGNSGVYDNKHSAEYKFSIIHGMNIHIARSPSIWSKDRAGPSGWWHHSRTVAPNHKTAKVAKARLMGHCRNICVHEAQKLQNWPKKGFWK